MQCEDLQMALLVFLLLAISVVSADEGECPLYLPLPLVYPLILLCYLDLLGVLCGGFFLYSSGMQ